MMMVEIFRSYLIMYFILRYSIDDQELLKVVEGSKSFNRHNTTVMVVDFLPQMKYIYGKTLRRVCEEVADLRKIVQSKYREHLITFKPEVDRDFCDCLIGAKFEAEAENREYGQYLTDDNLGLVLYDLFIGATDSTRIQLYWIILFMANFPKMQQTMRDEIENVIGHDQMVRHEHKIRLNYVQAFVSETLRHRPVFPVAIRKAIVNSTIAGHSIPKDTSLTMNLFAILHDPKYWDNPDEFRPERFLDENGVHKPRLQGFSPFGFGRRSCPGEKLALVDLILATSSLLQATRGYEIVLPDGPGSVNLYGDIDVTQFLQPESYKIALKPIYSNLGILVALAQAGVGPQA